MHVTSGASGAMSLGRLIAWASIQGTVGFTSLYAFSALLPVMAADPAIGAGRAGWVPWSAQAALMAVFIAWQLTRRPADRRAVIWLLALLALGTAAMSVAPSIAWLLAPTALAGAGSLAWSAIQAVITAAAATRHAHGATLTQWLGALMLATGALGRWAVIETAAHAGWRWGLRVLAIAAVTAALLLASRRFAPVTVAAGSGAEPIRPVHRAAVVWGSVTVTFTGIALSVLDYYEPAALHAADYANWTGPLGLAFLLGGILAALAMDALRHRRGTAVVAAAAATLLGAGLDLIGELMFTGRAWLGLLALGRIAIETGTTLLTVSLAAIVAERHGNGAHYARTYGFWRAAASTTTGLIAIVLWSHSAWAGITALSTAAAAIGLVAAIATTRTALSEPPGRHRRARQATQPKPGDPASTDGEPTNQR
jgi:hypothetical protein